ncbi:hypothetical protein [uncultured Campylobacter sp.]|uniref:hypothetical protein n=1 Tax=uncultured Campylobacter sp. TaxID=218934 RepID=UPI0026083CC2|nr:hypothetical protein [uncultured Campylobacter sp.]
MRIGLFCISVLLILFFGGCSNTWQGIKSDTKESVDWTKEKVHKSADWVSDKTK